MNTSISQALATGLPVIATKHSGFPEQVIEGANGWLVPEGDFKALADAIQFFTEHPELWASLSRYARQHVLSNYDNAALIEKQIKFYRKAISNSA